jgi:molecular chaperone DnaK (HSP70)
MARVEARNKAEAYLYQARSSIQEEQLKATIGEEGCLTVEKTVKDGLDWLDSNREASTDDLETKQKEWEDAIRPIMSAAASASAADSKQQPPGPAGPVVEEVD